MSENNLSRAWKCFVIVKKHEIISKYNNKISNNDVMKELGVEWRKLTDEEKISFINDNVPENHGKKWNTAEDNELLEKYRDGISIEEISAIHKRTDVGIRCRLMLIAYKIMSNENKTMDEIITSFNFSGNEFEKFVLKLEQKNKSSEVVESKEPDTTDCEEKEEEEKEKKPIKVIRVENIKPPFEPTEKQRIALDIMRNRENIFLTGAGGCGKTECIKYFIKSCCNDKKVGITSTTGTSAVLFGGTTLHSFLGIGLGRDTTVNLVKKIMETANISKRWRALDILIIDEISMLNPALFDKLNQIGKVIRNNYEKPFGGIQLILSGDFLQLPVVDSDTFCFEAKTWAECVTNVVCLTENIRQRDDRFKKCLNEIRFGIVSRRTIKLLNSRIGIEFENQHGIKPTKLYALNRDVEHENQIEVNRLANQGAEFYQYEMSVNKMASVSIGTVNKIIKNCQIIEMLELCVGLQVMLLKNLDMNEGLVNGSRGVIVAFDESSSLPIVRFLNGYSRVIDFHNYEIKEQEKNILTISQIPLRLAYAFSIHKLQGATLDCVELDLSNIFTYGQGYVALSRVKELKSLKILSIDYGLLQADPKCLEFYNNIV